MKECPMCGEAMRLSTREIPEQVPGRLKAVTRQVQEWICPECSYFEEADGGED